MTPLTWIVIGAVVLAATWYAARRVEGKGYACGYAAGRQDERRSDLHKLNQVFHRAVAQGLAARRELDYLYEQARRRIDELNLRCSRLSGRACSHSTEEESDQ